MNTTTRGILVMLAFQFLIGGSPLIIKSVNPSVSPMFFIGMRSLFACIVLTILATYLRIPKLSGLSLKQMWGIVLLGLMGSAIAPSLFFYSVHQIGAGLTNLLAELEIPIAIALAAIFLKERLTAWFFFCATQIFVGFVLASAPAGFVWQEGYVWGVAGAFASAVLWGLCTVLGKGLLEGEKVPPMRLAQYRAFFGLVGAAVFTALMFQNKWTTTLNGIDWFAILYTGVIVTGVGLWMYYYAVKILPVRTSSMMLIISPVITLLAGNFFAGEKLAMHQWIGVLLILAGIIQLFLKKETVTEPEPIEI